MNTTIALLPAPGTVLTYKEAIPAYDDFEDGLKSCVYNPSFFPDVTAYDLAWHIDDIARKYGIDEKRPFMELNELMHRFTMERTALANGKNGERFHLQNDAQALAKHDETHLFEVGIDGKKISSKLDECIELLAKEAATTDEYADAYSLSHPDRELYLDNSSKKGDKVFRAAMGTLIALWICLMGCMLVHTLFGVGVCTKWLM